MIAGGIAMTKAGASVEGMPDLNDLVAVEATRQSLFLVCLAEMVASDWRGIFGPEADDGEVAFDPAHVASLFTDPEVADSFSRFYLSGHTEVVAEGNV
ncbi:hypothetical protein ASG47_19730 [Devosia sp. Leaf420]|nr:hypothetical protein ASG47_19730 [Devosia sp. Leaf420]